MKTKVLEKIAAMSADTKGEIASVANIGLLGGITGTAANMFMKRRGIPIVGGKAFAIGTGTALAGDYVAVKMNKKIDKHFQKQASYVSNKYLEKIANMHN